MSKWADYLICGVQKDASETRILSVTGHQDLGTSIGPASQWSRQTVVNAIQQGTTFMTVLYKEGKYHRGANVGLVKVNGRTYLRTDKNETAADNLGNLPAYCPSTAARRSQYRRY